MPKPARNRHAVTITITTPRAPLSLAEADILPDRVLLQAKLLLNVAQAASVLNVSDQEIYNLVAKGELEGTDKRPLRVTSASVRRHMQERLGLDPLDM